MGRQSRKKAKAKQARRQNSPTEMCVQEAIAGPPRIVVIPGGIQFMLAAQIYLERLVEHYLAQGIILDRSIFEYELDCTDLDSSIDAKVKQLSEQPDFSGVEIHAQGGLGALVAYRLLQAAPTKIRHVFFIGSAPADALTNRAKKFYYQWSKLACYLEQKGYARTAVSFPNYDDTTAAQDINEYAERMARERPELYRQEKQLICQWNPDALWRLPDGKAFYVPNNFTPAKWYQTEMYDYASAVSLWYKHGVDTMRLTDSYFCSRLLMPTSELFAEMDQYRNLR